VTSILVVDDEPHSTRLLQRKLTEAGYQVEIAPDGRSAFERLALRRFDVLITDLCMPHLSGRELCLRVRERSLTEPLIFVLTSRPEDENRAWTRAFPNLEFMEKPVSLRRLLARVAERLAAADKVRAAETVA
jgi:DNA-binding response OmpR family regulator